MTEKETHEPEPTAPNAASSASDPTPIEDGRRNGGNWSNIAANPIIVVGGFVAASFVAGNAFHAQLDERERRMRQEIINELRNDKAVRDLLLRRQLEEYYRSVGVQIENDTLNDQHLAAIIEGAQESEYFDEAPLGSFGAAAIKFAVQSSQNSQRDISTDTDKLRDEKPRIISNAEQLVSRYIEAGNLSDDDEKKLTNFLSQTEEQLKLMRSSKSVSMNDELAVAERRLELLAEDQKNFYRLARASDSYESNIVLLLLLQEEDWSMPEGLKKTFEERVEGVTQIVAETCDPDEPDC